MNFFLNLGYQGRLRLWRKVANPKIETTLLMEISSSITAQKIIVEKRILLPIHPYREWILSL